MVDWLEVDTVLLDMDGTLIDLYFDNFLWNQRLPELVAATRGIGVEAAREHLYGHMRGVPRPLDYYSLDYWSRYVLLDMVELHRELSHLIVYRANACRFVRAVRATGRRAVLVTNAHPKSLAVKDARLDLTADLDAHYSAHTFGYPKQHGEFWSALARRDPYDPARTLFVDDDADVLTAARESGIDQLLCVAQPDSQEPKRSALPFSGTGRLRGDHDVLKSVRLDKWLWAARFFKTRSQAKIAIDGGHVRLNGKRAKAAKEVKCGDMLDIRRGSEDLAVHVEAVTERRGGATAAAVLYRETDASIAKREREAALRRAAGSQASYGRPSKRDRRRMEQLRQGRSRR